MPKSINTNQAVDRPSGSSNSYEPIPEGTYFGILRSVTWGEFPTNSGYHMEKFTPKVQLLNENRTIIDRQDLTIGAINDNGDYTNEFFEQADSSIIFGGYDLKKGRYGARNFMFVTAMLNSDGQVIFNEASLNDLVVKVQVKNRPFSWKGQTRYENVITWWDVPTADDIEKLIDANIDTSEWVTFNACVRAEEEDAPAEHARLVFETQDAFNLWYEIFYGGDDEWVHPIGFIETEETFLQSWNEFASGEVEQQEESEEVETPDDEGSDDEIPF